MWQIPTEVGLSIATTPVLLGIVGLASAIEWLVGLGVASEEVFRGDRLPVLHFPTSPESQNNT